MANEILDCQKSWVAELKEEGHCWQEEVVDCTEDEEEGANSRADDTRNKESDRRDIDREDRYTLHSLTSLSAAAAAAAA